MGTDPSYERDEPRLDPSQFLTELREHTRLLAEILRGVELDPCLLDKIGRIACLTANEVHKHTIQLKAMRESLDTLVEIYRTANPAAALELDRLAKLRAEIERCCPPEETCDPICCYEPCERHGGLATGDGYSRKSRGFVNPVQVGDEHAEWTIKPGTLNDHEILPKVAQGPLVGQLVPAALTL